MMAEHVGKDPQTYAEEFSTFYKELRSFHDLRGSSFTKLPQLHGHEVDLYLLYSLVTTRGGWEKVNVNGEWENLLPYFGVHRLCANGAIALKQIYIRYLDLYERIHFLGEDVDRRESELHDEDDARSRRRALRLLHATPLSYNLQQHYVADHIRQSNGLSTENIQVSPAERILLSLLCPLPNEQDFAINICSLLAMETRKSFPLQECPRLIDAILAHAGVFSQVSLRKHFIDCYHKLRGQKLDKFWRDVVPDSGIYQLSEEDLHVIQEETSISMINSKWRQPSPLEDDEEEIPKSPSSVKDLNASVDANESLTEDLPNLPGNDVGQESQPSSELVEGQKAVENTSAVESEANSPVYRNGISTEELHIGQNVPFEAQQENAESSVFETAAFQCQAEQSEQPNQELSFTSQEKVQSETLIEHQTESQNSLLCPLDASSSRGPEVQLERRFMTKSKLPTAVLKPDNPRAVNYWLKQRKCPSKEEEPKAETPVSEPSPDDWEIFHYERDQGVHDGLGQRVLQVLNVIRNLSFDESNAVILAQSEPCMRLLLLAAHAKWSCMPQLALDAISNLAIEISIKDPANSTLSAILLETVMRGLGSEDRFVAMRCIETLGRLALKPENESLLLSSIESPVYQRLCNLLTVPDVALLIYALECVYSLSSLGQTACNAFLNCFGALEVLMSLLTVEAQSYGSKARILMNVVETVADGEPVQSLAQFSNVQPQPRMQVTAAQPSTPTPNSTLVVSSSTAPSSPLQLTKLNPTQSFSRPSTPTQAKPNTATVSQPEKENAAVQWLKGSYESLVGAPSIEQNVLYRHYVSACSKNGQKQPLGMAQFLSCVRSTFGQNVGPFRKQVGTNVEFYFEGMSPKSQTAVLTNATATETSQPVNGDLPGSPILKAQLSAPPKSTNQKDKLIAEPSSAQSPCGTVQPSSSLIKSLLANKVQDNGPQNAGHLVKPSQTSASSSTLTGMTNSMNSHVTSAPVQNVSGSTTVQVAQRQQQQRLLQERENSAASKSAAVANEKANGTLQVSSTSEQSESKPPSKGMLADLLERDSKKQYSTGAAEQHDKELRIGDRGLELISKKDTAEEAKKSSLIAEVDDSGHVQLHLEEEIDAPSVCNGKSLLEQLEACEMSSDPPAKCAKRPASPDDDPAVSKKKVKQENGEATEQSVVEIAKDSEEISKFPNGQPPVATLSIQPAANATSSQPPRAFLILQPQAKTAPQGQRFMLAIQRPAGTLHHVSMPGNLVAIPANQVLTNGTINLASIAQTTTAENSSQSGTVVTAVTTAKQCSTIVVPVTSAPNSNPPAVQTSAATSSSLMPITTSIEGVVTFSGGAFAFPARPTETSSRVTNVMESMVTITPVPAASVSTSSVATSVSTTSVSTTSVSTTSVSTTSPVPGQWSAAPDAAKAKPKPATVVKTQPIPAPSDPSCQFMCEWKDCMRYFKTPSEVYNHACQAHCPAHIDEITCMWDHCDGLKRKRFSMMTHLLDRHCNDEMQKLLAARRFQMSTQGKTDIPAPQVPTPHPGYAPHAAFHAIKRHAAESLAQKEYEEKEGPVTKSIRLTSALILRNFATFSPLGRKCLQRYETHLAGVALSNVESSRTIAQVLYELTQQRS